MIEENQHIHLIWERSSPPAPIVKAPTTKISERTLQIPPGLTWLVAPGGCPPKLVRHLAANSVPLALLEPLLSMQRSPRLLLTNLGSNPMRVNGHVVPHFAVAHERDMIEVGRSAPLHVAIYSTPPIGPVPPGQVGRECPVCRLAFTPAYRCYTCVCGATMHAEDDHIEDGLQCAQLRASAGCPACKRPLILTAGYRYLPEEEGND